MSELNSVLQSGYYESPLGYNNVDWFVDEVLKLEIKMNFFSINTTTGIIMTEKDEGHYRNSNICRFCAGKIDSDKVGDRCHLTVE